MRFSSRSLLFPLSLALCLSIGCQDALDPSAGPDGSGNGVSRGVGALAGRVIGYILLGPDEINAHAPGDAPFAAYVENGAVQRLTHINYAFVGIDEAGHCALLDGTEPDKAAEVFAELMSLRELNPELRILFSVGGWAFSNDASPTAARFRDAAATPESRVEFARSCVDFMERYDFDGVDLDWEYPGFTEAEAEDFVAMLEAMRAELDAHGEHPLTIAGAGGAFFLSRYYHLLPEVVAPLDFINLMTYDFNGPWQGVTVTNHHAHLYGASGTGASIRYTERPYPTDDAAAEPMFYNALRDVGYRVGLDWETTVEMFPSPFALTVDAAVEQHLDAGVPPEKIVMGVPFYGRAFRHVADGGTHGLYQSFNTPGGDPYPGSDVDWLVGCTACVERREPRVATYGDIVEMLDGDHGYVRYFDEETRVPWLYNADHQLFVTYEDAESIAEKVNYVRDRGLGGVMFWHLGQDDAEGTLLRAIHAGLTD